jgi:hypothetical protein
MIRKTSVFVMIAVFPLMSLAVKPAEAQIATLFQEDFEGYSSFPHYVPIGDPVNLGIPKLSEGAGEIWYAGRFETPDSGTLNSDLAVQQFGGLPNNTHTGRFEDDAGVLFKISTLGYTDVKLDFDYRTFLTSSTDKFVAGYYVGDLNFGACAGNGESGCYRDFLNQDFAGDQAAVENWWGTQWTEIVRDRGDWKSVKDYSLPTEKESVWVAFWLDNGEGDYGKIDNVRIFASTTVIPEPIASILFMAGGGTLMAGRRFLEKIYKQDRPVTIA